MTAQRRNDRVRKDHAEAVARGRSHSEAVQDVAALHGLSVAIVALIVEG